MKKMFFGALLLLCGIIGIVMLATFSFIHPWQYNNTTGLLGYLLGSHTIEFFVLYFIMAIVGITICFYEAYIRK